MWNCLQSFQLSWFFKPVTAYSCFEISSAHLQPETIQDKVFLVSKRICWLQLYIWQKVTSFYNNLFLLSQQVKQWKSHHFYFSQVPISFLPVPSKEKESKLVVLRHLFFLPQLNPQPLSADINTFRFRISRQVSQ